MQRRGQRRILGWLIPVLGILLGVSMAWGYSPLMPVSPDQLDLGYMRFEVEAKATKDGGRDYIVRITQRDRCFRSGVSTGIGSFYFTETSEGSRSYRRLPYTPKGRTLIVYFSVTAEELQDPDLAFLLADPVLMENQEGDLVPAPSIDFHLLWLKDYPPAPEVEPAP